MSDADPPAPIPPTKGESSDLEGLDPGELLARGLHTVKPSAGASPWEPPTAEEVSRLLPQYRIEKLIGRGGMGAVYKGVQLTLDRPVAIKLLPAEIAADAQFVTRFQREARTLAKLQHSRIVTIHDSGQTSEGHLYFVMEYIDGTNLRDILRGPGLDPEQALMVVGQLCDALQAAHREGIVHRDIKPENVLISREGYVKLADFGLSRPPQEVGVSQLTQTNIVMGTPDYMAPEQHEGAGKADHRSDIFALGVMFYEMLTGRTPRGVFEPPSRKVQVDVRIDEVVLKALQSEPERRYQLASEMKTDVDRIRTTPLPAKPTAKPQLSAQKPGKALLPAAAICLVLLGLAGYFIWPKSGHPFSNGGPVSPPAVAGEVIQARGDTLPTPAANLITATRDAPFGNSLGMKFVPVPIVSGPTAGQRVLFGVWDVRVQDYAAYAGAKKVDDLWTKQQMVNVPVGRELNHPVAGVSWEDAQGFCQWLTEKETAEGKLPKGLKYRLPTDEEWSWAVGLPPELSGTPAEKSEKNSVDFPWGKDWPPRQTVGNYADEEFHAKFPPKKNEKEKRMDNQWIEGYNDGYATTSPVGSFPANAYGLYDMGGNVWQWCEDWFDASHKDRVLRGASWGNGVRNFLLSSRRVHLVPVGRSNNGYGFRCVLAPASTAGAQQSSGTDGARVTSAGLPTPTPTPLSVTAPSVASPPTPSSPNAAVDATKASKIIVPKIWFRQASVGGAAEFLRVKSRELDPDKAGVMIVLGASDRTKNIKVDLDVLNVSLVDGARYLAKAAGLELTIDGEVLILHPADTVIPAPANPDTSKAARIIFPKIEFREAPLDEGVELFRVKSRALDPAKSGVSIIATASAEAMNAKGDLDLTNVSTADAIRYFAVAADLKVTKDGEAFIFQGKAAPTSVANLSPTFAPTQASPQPAAIVAAIPPSPQVDPSPEPVPSATPAPPVFGARTPSSPIAAVDATKASKIIVSIVKPTASATNPATATKEQPLVNSLGMKFVPVPGTQVLFSVWDTRVQDYQAFVQQKVRSWPKPNFTQSATEPAVNVSWEDAQAFCAWLSKKEGKTYRLPTDAEWSAANGDGKYPWGAAWPPPAGAGNYGAPLGVDHFDHTSPVGSFAANRFGLCDMGGNVWQWCQERYRKTMNTSDVIEQNHFLDLEVGSGPVWIPLRMLRGGSWRAGDEVYLRSSTHYSEFPANRTDNFGFRVVLDPTLGAPPANLQQALLLSSSWSLEMDDNYLEVRFKKDGTVVARNPADGTTLQGTWQSYQDGHNVSVTNVPWPLATAGFWFNEAFTGFSMSGIGSGALPVHTFYGVRATADSPSAAPLPNVAGSSPASVPSRVTPSIGNLPRPAAVAQVPPQNPSVPQPSQSPSAPPSVANQPPPVAPQLPVAPNAAQPSTSEQPMIQVLSDQAPNVANWITAPLDREVPPEIWQNMTFLKEALRDEAARHPVASQAAYGQAIRLCYTMVVYLENRRQAETLSGGDAVLHQKSNLTEWRRDHLTWPMYALERDERAERQEKSKNTKVFLGDLKIQEWANRSHDMRTVIDAQYEQFREALRQNPAQKPNR